ncbi:hypothetical protein AB0D34_25415 [Streptomyces sp. NPDC048420]|uniref:hypothetical protein n=1 Tax=Streptomyces sp. NPDC048420 TaxID=3155755 RepID=UPI0034237678
MTWIRWEGGRNDTSPGSAWTAVAARHGAARSLRDGGAVREILPLDRDLAADVDGGQRA